MYYNRVESVATIREGIKYILIGYQRKRFLKKKMLKIYLICSFLGVNSSSNERNYEIFKIVRL